VKSYRYFCRIDITADIPDGDSKANLIIFGDGLNIILPIFRWQKIFIAFENIVVTDIWLVKLCSKAEHGEENTVIIGVEGNVGRCLVVFDNTACVYYVNIGTERIFIVWISVSDVLSVSRDRSVLDIACVIQAVF